MSGPAFTQMIRNRIHECAPDHSIETMTVGGLRAAAEQMAELYEALEAARRFVLLAQVDADPEVQDEARGALPTIDATLAKARGDQ